MLIRKEKYVVPEDGTYVAEVTNIEEWSSAQNPEYGVSLRFSFRVLEEPYVGSIITGLVSAQWREGNKLDKWLSALGLAGAQIDTELDPGMLKGRQCQITVQKDQKSGFTNVVLVMAMKSPIINQQVFDKPAATTQTMPQQITQPRNPNVGGPIKRDIPF